jgi:hypothetical protein
MSLWEERSAVFVVPRFTAQLNSLHPSFVFEDASHVSNGIPSPVDDPGTLPPNQVNQNPTNKSESQI